MLKAKALEAKVLEKIAASIPATIPASSYVVTGFWQPSAPGVIKNTQQLNSSSAVITVKTSNGRRPVASVSTVTYTVTVNLLVRLELDTQGEKLLDFTEPLQNLFDGWMAANYQINFTELDISGVSIDGVGVDSTTPSINVTDKVANVAWTLELSGNYT